MNGAELRVNVPVGMGQTLVGLLAPTPHRPAQVRLVGTGSTQEQVCVRVGGQGDPAVSTLAAQARQWQDLLADCLPAEAPAPEPAWEGPTRWADWPVECLDLSLRCTQALRRAGIGTLSALVQRDTRQLLALPHLGRRQVAEIVDMLAARGMVPGSRWPR